MNKGKLSLRRLFSNTKFLIVFSIALAFVFWIVVALEYAPVIDNTVENVPVKIELDNSVPDKLGLQIFGNIEYTVDITVRGNRYDIGGDLISADDFDVTAQTSYVNTAGNHTLKVKASIKDADADYEIIALSSEYIDVYFDRYEEKEVEVTTEIVSELNKLITSDYIFDENDIILSSQSVRVSGPKTEVDKVTGAKAEIIVEDPLTESITLDAEVKLFSDTTEEFKYVLINGEQDLSLPATLPVYKIFTLPVAVSFKNTPSDYINSPISYSSNPATVDVAVMQNGSNEEETLEVGVIDFSEISPEKTVFKFNASELVDVKVLDGTETFEITLDTKDLNITDFTVKASNIVISGASDVNSVDVKMENSGKVNVCGSIESLSSVTDNDILASIDLTDVEISGTANRVPVIITLKNKNDCWIYGTYYAVIRTK